MPKIVQFNLPPGGTVVELADNTSEALDIQGTDANEYISIDTIDSNPLISLKAADGSPGKAFEVRADGAVGFNNSNSGWMTYEDTTATNPTVGPRKSDWDTGIGSAAADQLSLIAGGTEAVQLRSGPEVHLGDYANDAGSNALVFKKSRSATTGTAAIVEDNDVLGLIEFQGADSAGTADSNFATGAKIFARVNGTPGDGDMPTELVFAMSKDNSETPVETLRIMPTATANKAQVTIGTDSYASAYTYSPIAVDAETQNGPVFERTSNGNAMVFQFNTKNCIAGSSHPISLMPGGTERLLVGTDGTVTATSGLLSSVGAIATALTSGSVSAGSSGSPSTTLAGSGTVFTTDFHVGAAIKVGTVTTTVMTINSDIELILEDAIDTATTGTTCTRDSGELFAVKTGDSKTLFSVQPTGAIGAGANANSNSGVYNNLGIGDPTMFDKLTTGNALFVMGTQSGDYDFTTANSLVAIGYNACAASTISQNLVAIGTYAADTSTNIRESVIIGGGAGRSSGNDSVHIGHGAGASCTGTKNISIGREALQASGAAAKCAAVGYYALNLATGDKNTALGYEAGDTITDGIENICIGHQSDAGASNNRVIAIGNQVAGTTNNRAYIGDGSHVATLDFSLASQSWSTTSDSRIKENVQDGDLGLDFINSLRTVKYTGVNPADWPEEIRSHVYFDRERTRTNANGEDETYTELANERPETNTKVFDGLIAQEVIAAASAAGSTFSGIDDGESNGLLKLQYERLVIPLIKAVQELTARVAELEAGD